MARHSEITAKQFPVSFAHPRSPRQRGSNENLNRIVREYFPAVPSKWKRLTPAEDPVEQVVSLAVGGHDHSVFLSKVAYPLDMSEVRRKAPD